MNIVSRLDWPRQVVDMSKLLEMCLLEDYAAGTMVRHRVRGNPVMPTRCWASIQYIVHTYSHYRHACGVVSSLILGLTKALPLSLKL